MADVLFISSMDNWMPLDANQCLLYLCDRRTSRKKCLTFIFSKSSRRTLRSVKTLDTYNVSDNGSLLWRETFGEERYVDCSSARE